ncbi:MAG: hypothetical protein MI865_10365, partial [Proteobacteria bacterium]|nr:hypothetical protein [Pseudomonadota bacterium]
KAAFYQTRYNLARERLPKTPVEPAQVKVAVDAAKTLKQYKSTPYEMLTYLGKGLEKFPEIKLDNLEWSYSVSPVGNDTSSNDSDLPPALNNESKVKYYQISNIKAHIEPFDGNYREAISLVNEFAETLRSFESTHQIIIESFPLDISSDAQLQGDYGGVGKEALFTLTAIIGIN